MVNIFDTITMMLIKSNLTASQIADKLQNVPKKNLWSYLSILKDKGKIEKIGVNPDTNENIYHSTTIESMLFNLYNIMNDKMEPTKQLTPAEMNVLEKIQKLIETFT